MKQSLQLPTHLVIELLLLTLLTFIWSEHGSHNSFKEIMLFAQYTTEKGKNKMKKKGFTIRRFTTLEKKRDSGQMLKKNKRIKQLVMIEKSSDAQLNEAKQHRD